MASVSRNSDVSNSAVFALTGTVGDNCSVASAFSHFDCIKSFSKRTDLVNLNEDGVTYTLLDTIVQTLSVCYEQIVTNELYFAAELVSKQLPAIPVILGAAVFDRYDWVFINP
ncbi:hypothetical protein D3C80_1779530 [compost metagenome]